MPRRAQKRPAPLPRRMPAPPIEEIEARGPDAELLELMESFGGAAGFLARIDRRVRGGGEPDYLGSIELTPELLDDVKTRFGGGKYRARIVDASGKYLRSLSFGIGGTPRAESDQAAPAPAGELTKLELLIAGMAASITSLAERMAAPARSNIAEFAEVAKVIRDLTPAPVAAAPAAAPGEMFTMLNSMLDLRERIADDAEPRDRGTDFAAVVDKGVTPLVGLLSRKLDMEENAMKQRRDRREKAPAEKGATSAAPQLPASPLARVAGSIPTMARNYLASCAKADKDPELYAELVLDALPESVFAQLPELLGDAEFSAKLCALVQPWAPYPGWFARLADALRASILEDGADVDDAPPAVPAEAFG